MEEILWNARIIDPGAETVIARGALTIRDGRIDAVEEISGPPPEGARDVAGATILPGLIDVHTHVISDTERSPGFGPAAYLSGEDPRPRELGWFILSKTAEAYVDAGITTVRDVGSFDDEAIVLRKAIELGLSRGPRLRSCGRIISATAPGTRIFGTMYHEANGPWAMRAAVRENLKRGADFVKFMSTGARSVEREDPEPAQMTRDEAAALIDEAHRMGLRVAAHAEGLDGTRMSVLEGADTIEHGFALHREPALLDHMAEHGQVLVPTLTTFHDLAERFADRFVPSLVEQAKRQLAEAYLTLEAGRNAGVIFGMGYDSGPPGCQLWEAHRMAEGGLGTMAALRAATLGGAQALGINDIGRLSPGCVADLVLVDGDPLADIKVLLRPNRILRVYQRGVATGGAEINGPYPGGEDEMLPTGPPSPCCMSSA